MSKKGDALAEERAEERTILSFIRTFLTVLGIILVFLQLYFKGNWWMIVVVVVLSVLFFLVIIEEIVKYRKIRRLRERKLEKLKN